jgi:hypothetical protein
MGFAISSGGRKANGRSEEAKRQKHRMAHLIGRLVAYQACDTPDLLICRADLAC